MRSIATFNYINSRKLTCINDKECDGNNCDINHAEKVHEETEKSRAGHVHVINGIEDIQIFIKFIMKYKLRLISSNGL